jgi:hypothetical protein
MPIESKEILSEKLIYRVSLHLTINLDLDLNELKDHLYISSSISCYIYPEKKSLNLRKKLLKTNIPQNILSSAIHELLAVITLHMCFNKKLYQAWLVSKNRSLQKKILLAKYFYKK